jgi:hypothetical protein
MIAKGKLHRKPIYAAPESYISSKAKTSRSRSTGLTAPESYIAEGERAISPLAALMHQNPRSPARRRGSMMASTGPTAPESYIPRQAEEADLAIKRPNCTGILYIMHRYPMYPDKRRTPIWRSKGGTAPKSYI